MFINIHMHLYRQICTASNKALNSKLTGLPPILIEIIWNTGTHIHPNTNIHHSFLKTK